MDMMLVMIITLKLCIVFGGPAASLMFALYNFFTAHRRSLLSLSLSSFSLGVLCSLFKSRYLLMRNILESKASCNHII